MQSAFRDLSAGQESDVVEVARGEAYAVRVERIVPPGVPALADVRDLIVRQYIGQTMAAQLRARITAIQARIDRGESITAIAASVRGQVGNLVGLSRSTASAEQNLRPSFLQAMFNASQGQSFLGEVSGGVAAGKVTAIRTGDLTAIARMTEGARDNATRQLFDAIGASSRQWAMTNIRVRTDLNRARTVLGVDPATIPAAAGTPAANSTAASAAPAAASDRAK